MLNLGRWRRLLSSDHYREFLVAVAIDEVHSISHWGVSTAKANKRHAMHAEAMTFHKGSLIIFRTFVKKLGYIKVTDNFCAE